MTTATDRLRALHACPEAIEWAENYDDPQKAWDECVRGDWMLWILGRLAGPPGSDSRRPLVLACCECARMSLGLVPDDEDRPRICIETAESWARGEGATLDDVRRDSDAAYDSYTSASAYDAAYASVSASDAAYDTPYAAYAANSAALSDCADIVRRHYPVAPDLGGHDE